MRYASILALLLILFSCGKTRQKETTESPKSEPIAKEVSKYPNHIGDIAFDESLDDPEFKPCQSSIPQYYALGADFRVDNDVLMSHFESVSPSQKQETAFHTIRFIVNCKGKIGRLRVETMSAEYQVTVLDSIMSSDIREKLLAFDQWPQGRDFYQYLTFKIEKGKIKQVMP